MNPAIDLARKKHGDRIVIAGMVIGRQRQGNMFIRLEDEMGIANAFVRSELF